MRLCRAMPITVDVSTCDNQFMNLSYILSVCCSLLAVRCNRYFNQASPSAYVRGRDRVVPFTLSLLRNLEISGARVLNGADVFAFELSKSAQAARLQALGIDHPRSVVFNDVEALAKRSEDELPGWPAMLKPEQGGSGARMHKVRVCNPSVPTHTVTQANGFTEQPRLVLSVALGIRCCFALRGLLSPAACLMNRSTRWKTCGRC